MQDTGAVSATIIDQGEGTDPLTLGVTRRGFAQAINWLPAACLPQAASLFT